MPLAKVPADKSSQLEAIAKLPRLSCLVLEAVLQGQYAESGFSDVEAEDLKIEGATPGAVAGAIGYLAEIQLISVEPTKVNNKKHRFLHATAHTGDFRDEALAAVRARKAELKKGKPKKQPKTKAKKESPEAEQEEK